MELLDAMEEMERQQGALHVSPPANPGIYSKHKLERKDEVTVAGDFVEQQVVYVQNYLRKLWEQKYPHQSTTNLIVPYYWVFAKLLRLVEEYPDGLTEAVIVTELMSQLQHKVQLNHPKALNQLRTLEDASSIAADLEQEAIHAMLVGYERHRLAIEVDKLGKAAIHMYLHQRFRSCVEYLAMSQNLHIHSAPGFPFQAGRSIIFTNAKFLERKDVDITIHESDTSKFCLLPMAYMALQLNRQSTVDQSFLNQSVGLMQLDHIVSTQDDSVRQQMILQAKVLDIGAIRPCKEQYHIHRQVILLGETTPSAQSVASSSIPSHSQRLASGSHLLILWDDQVALSRLFHVGDIMIIFHPFVHMCEPNDVEISHIFREYSSQQQRCTYYLEYGSATVLFVQQGSNDSSSTSNGTLAANQGQPRVYEQERPWTRFDEIQRDWINFAVYGHVRSIRVSHGIPLLAAFFYSYYDPKTNITTHINQTPSLDRAIVSKYYLVVLLEIYNEQSNQILAVEVTGENARKALRLHCGQSIFMDGLVAVDIHDKSIQRIRQGSVYQTTNGSSLSCQAEASCAFYDQQYKVTTHDAPSSSIVSLCSDWGNIFGNQSIFASTSTLTLVNEMPGLLKTSLWQCLPSMFSRTEPSAFMVTQVCIMRVGWLVPTNEDSSVYMCDDSCEKGFSTMCAHRPCRRQLGQVSGRHQQESRPVDLPKWRCSFCQEIFTGMEETMQTFCELVVYMDGSSYSTSEEYLVAVCYGEIVETIVGVPAYEFSQLSLEDKRNLLKQAVGKDFQVLLSRCEPRVITMSTSSKAGLNSYASSSSTKQSHSSSIHVRIDQLQPVDTFAFAHQLLKTLN